MPCKKSRLDASAAAALAKWHLRPGSADEPRELWECVNPWVAVSPLEIKKALAIRLRGRRYDQLFRQQVMNSARCRCSHCFFLGLSWRHSSPNPLNLEAPCWASCYSAFRMCVSRGLGETREGAA